MIHFILCSYERLLLLFICGLKNFDKYEHLGALKEMKKINHKYGGLPDKDDREILGNQNYIFINKGCQKPQNRLFCEQKLINYIIWVRIIG